MSRRRSTLMNTQEKVARSLAGEDLTLSFNAARPMVDIVKKHIKLPPIPDEVSHEVEAKVRAWTDHESAHIRFNSEPWTMDLMKDKVLRKLAFGFEDIRVDRKNGEKFPGTLDNRRRMFDIVRPELPAGNVLQAALWSIYEITKGYFEIAPSAKYWAGVLGEPQAEPVLAYMMNAVEDQIKRMRVAETPAEVIEISREVKEIWHDLFKNGQQPESGEGENDDDNKMNDGGMFGEKQEQSENQQGKGKPSRGQSQSSDDDMDDIPEDIEDCEDDSESGDGESEDSEDSDGDDSESGESDDDSDDSEDADSEDADSDDSSSSKGSSSNNSSDSESESEQGGDEDAAGDDDEKSDEDVDREMDDMVDDMDDLSDIEREQVERDLNPNGDDDTSSYMEDDEDDDVPTGFLAWTGDDVVEDIKPKADGLHKFDDTGCYVRGRNGYGYAMISPAEFKADVKSKIGTLQRRLMLDLQSRRRLWVKDRTRGVIDDTRLDRVGTGDGRVFKRKLRRPDLNIAVTTLLDCSGSMEGFKMYLCGQIGYIIAETMASLGVAHEALGFTSISSSGPNIPSGVYFHRRSRLRQLVIKPFNMTKRPQMLERFYSAAQFDGCGTPMGEPVIWAAKRLAQRQEARKVLIVICDGEPCGGGWNDASGSIWDRHTKRCIKRVEQAGIETIGVGIQTSTIAEYFEKSVNYEGLDSLLTGFYREFSKLLRGHKNRQERPVPTT